MTNKRVVLVVDDNEINREMLYFMLKEEYQVLLAENGRQALNILNDRGKEISAILLDLVMPVMNGYEFLEEKQKRKEFSTIPVIIESEQNGEESEIDALARGANDFVIKPFNPVIIRYRLANLIKLQETSAALSVFERDSLTSLYNQAAFYKRTAAELADHPEIDYDIIVFDIEQFKLVNDFYGTKEGDRLLIYLAEKVLYLARELKGICARFSGDLFYLFTPAITKEQENMILSVQDYMNEYPLSLRIQISIGIFHTNEEVTSVPNMCDRAHMAANTIKENYTKTLVYYDNQLLNKMKMEQIIISEMKQALVEHQFHAYYQPKIELLTNRISGAEALVRWEHPERGIVSPADFIPVFERNGFITELDLYMCEQACELLASWKKEGKPMIPISVNISRVDIYNTKLLPFLRDLMERYDVPVEYLHLEITETAYTENTEQMLSIVNEIKKMGFILEMDDFGSGYSSLNILTELPIDVLKLDIMFLKNGIEKEHNRYVIELVIQLAKKFHMVVVAEGVEQKEEAEFLRNVGCHLGQGYYFSRPLNKQSFLKLIETGINK